VAVLFGILLIFGIFYLFRTSLLITTTLEKKGAQVSACGMVTWGLFGMKFCWRQEEEVMDVMIMNHSLWSRARPRGPTGATRSESLQKPSEERKIAWGALLPEALHALAYLARHLRLKSLYCDIVLGFSFAPTTGKVYGYFHAIKGILSPISSVSLHMTPDFDRAVFDGRFSTAFEVRYPLILAFRLLRIGMHPPVRDVLFRRESHD